MNRSAQSPFDPETSLPLARKVSPISRETEDIICGLVAEFRRVISRTLPPSFSVKPETFSEDDSSSCFFSFGRAARIWASDRLADRKVGSGRQAILLPL